MEFTEAITKVKQTLNAIGSDISTDKYDGLIVKKLESSNTLDDDRSTNQTHIAITGNQMDIFPYVRADGYFDVEYEAEDNILKKYFVVQIPTYLHKENVQYLKPDASESFSDEHLVHISVVRSRRRQSADQVQMSMTNIDSPAYKEYRKLVHAKTYMILLKRERQLVYDLYSVKEADGDGLLQDLNNGFYKLRTNTPVEADAVLLEDKVKQGKILLPFEQSKECARQIVDCIYDIDAFVRLKDVLENNDKSIKANFKNRFAGVSRL